MAKVPLYEQLEELEDQYGRMHRSYPGLIARGMLRKSVAELHLERMAAAVNTLAWLVKHGEVLLQYIEYAKKTGLQDPIEDGEPPCVLNELQWEEPETQPENPPSAGEEKAA